MDKDYLLEEAKKIRQPSAAAALEFSQKRETITALIKKELDSRTDIGEPEAGEKSGMDRNDHTYHMKHMEALFAAYSPEEYVNTTLWTVRMYVSHGFNIDYWASIIDVIVSILKKELSGQAYSEIYPFYRWMTRNIGNFKQICEKSGGL